MKGNNKNKKQLLFKKSSILDIILFLSHIQLLTLFFLDILNNRRKIFSCGKWKMWKILEIVENYGKCGKLWKIWKILENVENVENFGKL